MTPSNAARPARVDHDRTRLYTLLSCLAIAASMPGCAGATGALGAPDPLVEERLAAAATPSQRVQIFFDWNMTDRDARFSGRGVLRLEPAHRVRVDLFGPRGETLAAAIADGDDMRVAPEGAAALLPPAALLWSSLGVFRPPVDAPLTGTSVTGDETRLEYARAPVTWRFRFAGDRLVAAEWTDGNGRRTVELTGSAQLGFPQQAVFRDWTEFRELTIRVTEIEQRTTPFEPDVWILPGER